MSFGNRRGIPSKLPVERSLAQGGGASRSASHGEPSELHRPGTPESGSSNTLSRRGGSQDSARKLLSSPDRLASLPRFAPQHFRNCVIHKANAAEFQISDCPSYMALPRTPKYPSNWGSRGSCEIPKDSHASQCRNSECFCFSASAPQLASAGAGWPAFLDGSPAMELLGADAASRAAPSNATPSALAHFVLSKARSWTESPPHCSSEYTAGRC